MNDREKDTLPEGLMKVNQNELGSELPPQSENPREFVENPAVAPEMLETAPEDLRGDLFKDPTRSDR